MYPYLRKEKEQDKFNAIFDIASKLFLKRKSNRQKAANKLVAMGKKSVRPVVYILECGIESEMIDDELDRLADEVEDIVVKIGEEALPDLKDFATNGHCNIYVNEFAQETIFKILKLDGNDKRKVCKHMERVLIEKEKKKVWQCVHCDAEFTYKKKT